MIEFFIRFLRASTKRLALQARYTGVMVTCRIHDAPLPSDARAWSAGGFILSFAESRSVPIDFLPLRSPLDVAQASRERDESGRRGIRLNYGPGSFVYSGIHYPAAARVAANFRAQFVTLRRRTVTSRSRFVTERVPPARSSVRPPVRPPFLPPTARAPSLQLWPLITFLFVEFPDR